MIYGEHYIRLTFGIHYLFLYINLDIIEADLHISRMISSSLFIQIASRAPNHVNFRSETSSLLPRISNRSNRPARHRLDPGHSRLDPGHSCSWPGPGRLGHRNRGIGPRRLGSRAPGIRPPPPGPKDTGASATVDGWAGAAWATAARQGRSCAPV